VFTGSPVVRLFGCSVASVQTRIVPSSGERLPVIGCGTWRAFDVPLTPDHTAPLIDVLRILFDDGSVIDTSPMYGRAEAVVGACLETSGTRERSFLATKVWTRGGAAGIEQMERSMMLLRIPSGTPLDLMQIHNLVDYETHLRTLRAWKEQGRIRYLGVTHYTASAHADLEAVMRREPLDFVQLNYSVEDSCSLTPPSPA
jgi:diketogulonate reductase-like aldo/keto reductase